MSGWSGARVLVVDDDHELRLSLQDWLSFSGYTVVGAGEPLEARDLVRRSVFDVVVTDLVMPGGDGLSLLHELKATQPDIQVIFLTGQGTIEIAVEAMRDGRSVDFLQKPLLDLNRLNQAIEAALARRRALRPQPAPVALPELLEASERHPLVARVVEQIQTRYREPIGLREIALALDYSPSYLTDLMRRETGRPLLQWLQEQRMHVACQLLRETDWPIARIAREVGFTDPGHFNRRFRARFAQPPQGWRLSQGPGA